MKLQIPAILEFDPATALVDEDQSDAGRVDFEV